MREVRDDARLLRVQPRRGTAPASAEVSIRLGRLAPGTYTGAIEVRVRRGAAVPVIVPVMLTVVAPPP